MRSSFKTIELTKIPHYKDIMSYPEVLLVCPTIILMCETFWCLILLSYKIMSTRQKVAEHRND